MCTILKKAPQWYYKGILLFGWSGLEKGRWSLFRSIHNQREVGGGGWHVEDGTRGHVQDEDKCGHVPCRTAAVYIPAPPGVGPPDVE